MSNLVMSTILVYLRLPIIPLFVGIMVNWNQKSIGIRINSLSFLFEWCILKLYNLHSAIATLASRASWLVRLLFIFILSVWVWPWLHLLNFLSDALLLLLFLKFFCATWLMLLIARAWDQILEYILFVLDHVVVTEFKLIVLSVEIVISELLFFSNAQFLFDIKEWFRKLRRIFERCLLWINQLLFRWQFW